MKSRLVLQLFVFFCLVAITGIAWAQSPTTGEVAGTVLDPQGAAVSGAKLSLTSSSQATPVDATAFPRSILERTNCESKAPALRLPK